MAIRHLSPGQLQVLADTINTGGGFSVKAVGDDAGRRAVSGYMVGSAGLGQDSPAAEITADQIGQFVSDREVPLTDPRNYLGGWQGADPVRGSLDVARHYERTRNGLTRARMAALIGNQEEIGMVDAEGEYEGGISNPYYDKEGGHEARRAPAGSFNWAHGGRPVGPLVRANRPTA